MDFFFNQDLITKFLKFGIVGGIGVVVDFLFTYVFKEVLKVPKYIANAVGFTIAATSNYLLNRIWTFNSHNPHIVAEYTKFIGVSLIGLGINTLILWFLVSRLKKKFYFSKLIAIAIVTVWNFFANLFYTFALS